MFSRKSNIGRARPIRRCNAERLEFAGYRRLLNAIFAGEPIEVPRDALAVPERVVVPDAVLLWRYQNFIEPNPKLWN